MSRSLSPCLVTCAGPLVTHDEVDAEEWAKAYRAIGHELGDDEPERAGLERFAGQIRGIVHALRIGDLAGARSYVDWRNLDRRPAALSK